MVIRVNKINDSDKEREEIVKALEEMQKELEVKKSDMFKLEVRLNKIAKNNYEEEAVESIIYGADYIQDAIGEIEEALSYLEEEGD